MTQTKPASHSTCTATTTRPRRTSATHHAARTAQTLALSALLGLFAGSAAFAASTSAPASAVIHPGLTTSTLQSLDFGVITPDPHQPSTVTVVGSGDNMSICGASLSCLQSGNRARMEIGGRPGARLTLSDPSATVLSDGSGHSMVVDDFVIEQSGQTDVFQIGSGGIATLDVSATLHVGANQSPGFYSGTYTVTASYE